MMMGDLLSALGLVACFAVAAWALLHDDEDLD